MGRTGWVLFWWAEPCSLNLQSNFLLMGGAVFSPYSLPWGQTMVGVMAVMVRSDQISRSVVSDSLQRHESQHARPTCPSPTPRVYSNSCPSSRWCHPAISSSVVPFSSSPNPSQYQGLFQWVSSLHQVAKVLVFMVLQLWIHVRVYRVYWYPPV